MTVKSIKDAEELFSRTWGRSVSQFTMIFNFRRLAAYGLPHISDSVLESSMKLANALYDDPEYDHFFRDKEAALKALGGADKIAKEMTDNQVKQFQYSVDTASLVFAHSILDSAAMEYCQVTAWASPSSWEQFVKQKQIKLEEVRDSAYEDILQVKIQEYLLALDRESITLKVDRLFAVCKPPDDFAPIDDYRFDNVRLRKFDKDRHEIVHGGPPANPLPNGDNDIWFLMQTSNYFMAMVNNRFGLKMDSEVTMREFAST